MVMCSNSTSRAPELTHNFEKPPREPIELLSELRRIIEVDDTGQLFVARQVEVIFESETERYLSLLFSGADSSPRTLVFDLSV